KASAGTSSRRRGRSSSPDATSGVSGQSRRSARRSRSSSVIALPEPVERARDARLDGTAADAERGRGLRLVELEQVAARERAARELALLVEWTALHRPHYTARYAAVPSIRGALDRGGACDAAQEAARLDRAAARPESCSRYELTTRGALDRGGACDAAQEAAR